jgi:hypothetical protein
MGDEALDFDFEEEIDFEEEPPRGRAVRRTVLAEDPSQDRVEVSDRVVDADAPIASGDVLGPADRGMAAPTGPTREQVSRWEVEEDPGLPSAARDAIHSSLPLPGRDSAAERILERVRRLRDQATSSDATLGGRNPIRPIVGSDERGAAPIAAIYEALPIDGGDELDARAARAREQAPELARVGDTAAAAMYAATPSAPSAVGRVALGALEGASVGLAHADEGEELASTLMGGALGGGGAAIPEAPGAMRSAGTALRRGSEVMQEFGDQARLEASGFWGRRAADRIAEPGVGGPARLAEDLRRYGVGQGRGQVVPRSEQAGSDLATLGRGGGQTMDLIARSADETGARIPSRGVIERAEQIARRLEDLGTDTAQRAAERIRREVAPLAQRPDMTPSRAWALRRHFDQLADFGGRAGDDAAMAAGDQFRELRHAIDRDLDMVMQSAGLSRQWDEASRMAQMGALSREIGLGHRRLSTGGGIAGATSSGDAIMDAIQSGNPLRVAAAPAQALLGRALSQEQRMLTPGALARGAEGTAGAMRGASDVMTQAGRAGSDPAVQRILRLIGATGRSRAGQDQDDARAALFPGPPTAYAQRFAEADEEEPNGGGAALHFELQHTDPQYRAALSEEETDDGME